MASPRRLISRPVVHLIAASIFGAFALQTEWALGHDFENYSNRVFGTALLLFLVLQALRLFLGRVVLDAAAGFDERYGEMVLLLALVPVFSIIDNGLLHFVALALFAVMLVSYGAAVLRVAWCMRLREWLANTAIPGFRRLAGRRLAYTVNDDTEPGVLHVRLRAPGEAPSPAEFKARVATLYQCLPDDGTCELLRVDASGVSVDDETLARLLEPLALYASLAGFGPVSVHVDPSRVEALAAILPAERFTVAPAAESATAS